MRYLYFDVEAGLKVPSDTFEMVYDSVLNAPGGYEGPAENRLVARILDKLDALGEPARRNNQDVASLRADSVGVYLALEDAEYDLLSKTLKSIRWVGTYSRKADEMYEWLAAAPKKERPPEVAPAEATSLGG